MSYLGEYGTEIYPILQAIKSLPSLENLTLATQTREGASLRLLFEYLALPYLKSMSLTGYGVGITAEDIQAVEFPCFITPSDRDNLMPPEKYRTGNLTSLELSAPLAYPSHTEHIILSPSHLTNLSLNRLSDTSAGVLYTTDVVQKLFDHHRSSLKHITIGTIGKKIMNYFASIRTPNSVGILDFSQFLCLEQLNISAWNIIKNDAVPDAVKKLSAPNLRSVTMDFHTEAVEIVALPHDFGETEVKWMHDFAKLTREQYPNSKLERIVVVFEPAASPKSSARLRGTIQLTEEDVWHVSWPWRYLEKARLCVEEFGLTVEFAPKWTKKEWDRICRQSLEEMRPGLSEVFSKCFT